MAAAIFLIHGFSSSSKASWERNGWLDLLADAGREVVAPDLLGHGEAPKPHDPGSYGAVEELAYSELKGSSAVGAVDVVDVVGFSMGARIALLIEVAHPGTFGRIVVGGLGNNLFEPRDVEPVALAIEGNGEATDPLVRAFASAASTPPNDPAALAAFLRGAHRRVWPEDLATVRCPVLIAIGSEDVLVRPVEPLVSALEDSVVVTIPGVDHLGTMKGYGFLEAAFEFLDVEQG
jgi:pimeloyl-ACP methyl ester carboxylesterase